MIPIAYLREWAAQAPWPDLRQVEQDLIICRAICDIFSNPRLAGKLAFRGGTAIHKLMFERPLRYSEDIDLVQTQAEPIGETANAIHEALAWLGKYNWRQAEHSIHLTFKFAPEVESGSPLKLKVEINTREHQNLYGLTRLPFEVNSSWHHANAEVLSFEPEELFGTKLRALLQRHKWTSLTPKSKTPSIIRISSSMCGRLTLVDIESDLPLASFQTAFGAFTCTLSTPNRTPK